MLVLIRGAGDIASGIALRLHNSKFKVIMADIPQPTAIRRTVSFSQAIYDGTTKVEAITAKHAHNVQLAIEIMQQGHIPVLADPELNCLEELRPDVLVDAVLAKHNLGTKIDFAPVVIGVGPGFEASKDCHAVIETQRGHNLGRVITEASAAKNTGIPGNIGGFTLERILRAPAEGIFRPLLEIGASVKKGDVAGMVLDTPMVCQIDGILRGILPEGTPVFKGMKSGDIDPRCELSHCYTVSDKALAVGGGVLEAILSLSTKIKL